MSAWRVVLADDHALVRAGIRSLLEQMEGVAVVGEAANGDEALEVIAATRPDVALVDIAMRGTTGLDLAARLADSHPAVRVLILSMHANPGYVEQALRAGAAGYLVKDAAAAELSVALEALRRGEIYLSPAVSRTVVGWYVAQRKATPSGGVDGLSPRQTEILSLLAAGRSTKQVARQLGISVKTVETHRAALMERLDIHDLPGLVRYALGAGLIPPLD